MDRKIPISDSLRQRIMEFQVVGTGGYQALVAALQKRLDGDVLIIDDKFYSRLEHYAFDFGSGGWQKFLREILAEVDQNSAQP